MKTARYEVVLKMYADSLRANPVYIFEEPHPSLFEIQYQLALAHDLTDAPVVLRRVSYEVRPGPKPLSVARMRAELARRQAQLKNGKRKVRL